MREEASRKSGLTPSVLVCLFDFAVFRIEYQKASPDYTNLMVLDEQKFGHEHFPGCTTHSHPVSPS